MDAPIADAVDASDVPIAARSSLERVSTRRFNRIYATSSHQTTVDQHRNSKVVTTDRRLQVLPGLVVFSGTFSLILLSVCVLIVLLSQNMFERQAVTVNAQLADTYNWAPYGQSCRLQSDGFVANSCDNNTASVIPTEHFRVLGAVLAAQWKAELVQAGEPLYITTCVIGGTEAVGWTDLQFIAGYDHFPDCLPSAPQDVAGFAMLETTLRDSDDYYLLTLFADLDSSMTPYKYANSDGTTDNLISNAKLTLISMDGTVAEDTLGGMNNVITSRPLGSRYIVTGYCITVIEELSDLKNTLDLTGWSQGKYSQVPIVPAWSCGHVVANPHELVALQIVSSIASLWFFAGDIYITVEGLRGLLTGQPVLKYSMLSGLERRKWLLVCIVVNSMPGLLYMDVARTYYYSANGFRLYALSSLMVATFVAFGSLLALSVFDAAMGYVKVFRTCVGYSAPVFIGTSILWMAAAWCRDDQFLLAYNKFYAAPPVVGFWVNDAVYPSGSYVADGTSPIAVFLAETIASVVGCSLALAILLSSLYRRFVDKQWLVSTAWAQSNSLLHEVHLPSCITALPLEPSNGIKIGTTIYCKPSTIALLGYATVERSKPDLTTLADPPEVKLAPHLVVSIYALVPALLFSISQVRSIGAITRNKFTPQKTKLERKPYRHTRGSCVG